jgi:Zn finger protein HypA/HybF involved in hydrogenase expression
MAFQFQCPQGHLLEGEESQAGQQCQCPTCNMLFIIPQPIGAAVESAPGPAGRFGFVEGGSAAQSAAPIAPAEPELLHIPCPNGHELETPLEMLDQDVLCPQCNAQFKLRRKDSVEYKRKKELHETLQLERTGSLWLNIAIVAIVFVAILFIGLIIMSQMGGPPPIQPK